MLGHADVASTLRLDAHVTPTDMEALADAIDAGYGLHLRVLNGSRNSHEMASPNESPALSMETECRERESNPREVTDRRFLSTLMIVRIPSVRARLRAKASRERDEFAG
jgi:hypothetical protein